MKRKKVRMIQHAARKRHLPILFLGYNLLAAPVLSIPESSHDFGKMAVNQKVKAVFKVANLGDETLTFSAIPTCGCTTAVVGKNSLAPGESGNIEITYDSKGQQGRIFKPIAITSNDPAKRATVITVTGEVVADINPKPDIVYFMGCKRGETRRALVTLASESGKPVHVLGISHPDSPFLRVRESAMGADAILEIEFESRGIPGGQREGISRFLISTDSDLQPTLSVVVEWEIESLISIQPDHVIANGVAGREMRIPMTLEHRNKRPFRILGAASSDGKFRVKITSGEKQVHHECVLIVPQELGAGAFSDIIRLSIDDLDQPEVKFRAAVVIK
jgi:hypothetical protein